jgi:hypothetical protein
MNDIYKNQHKFPFYKAYGGILYFMEETFRGHNSVKKCDIVPHFFEQKKLYLSNMSSFFV